MTTELVPSVSVENMVNQRAAVVDKITAAFALIQEAADLAAAARIGMPRIMVTTDYGRGHDGLDVAAARIKTNSRGQAWDIEQSPQADLAKKVRLGVDCAAWQYLMSESGLRSLMDSDARRKWDEAITRGDIPELTAANVRSTFGMLHDSRGEMFERGVIACFRSLAWDYKTNLPQKFGRRIVLTYLRGVTAGRFGGKSFGHTNYQTCDRLDDLSRVFSVLDGKPEPDHRSGWYGRLNRVEKLGDPDAADDYMTVRSFRNGNGHVTFRRPELVDQLNRIIAKHYPGALPEPKS